MDVIIPKTTITCPAIVKEPETPLNLTIIFLLPVLIVTPSTPRRAEAERVAWGRAKKDPFI